MDISPYNKWTSPHGQAKYRRQLINLSMSNLSGCCFFCLKEYKLLLLAVAFFIHPRGKSVAKGGNDPTPVAKWGLRRSESLWKKGEDPAFTCRSIVVALLNTTVK